MFVRFKFICLVCLRRNGREPHVSVDPQWSIRIIWRIDYPDIDTIDDEFYIRGRIKKYNFSTHIKMYN